MAQLVKRPTLGFSSGHDLTVHEFEPILGSALTVWSLLRILSLPLSATSLLRHTCSLSLSLSLKIKK